jgi:hypothetical protein
MVCVAGRVQLHMAELLEDDGAVEELAVPFRARPPPLSYFPSRRSPPTCSELEEEIRRGDVLRRYSLGCPTATL